MRRILRRPANAFELESYGDHRFIAENQLWDADDWEALSRATGLYNIDAEVGLHDGERWRKLFMKTYFEGQSVVEAIRRANEQTSDE